jgi:hypothetical protein
MEQAHRYDIIGYPRANLVLEAQTLLMGGLKRMVQQLLQGITSQSWSEKWDVLANAGFRGSLGSETLSVFLNQPYTAPLFEPDCLVEITQARHTAAEDHLWSLQIDPAYFQFYVRQETQGQLLKNTRTEVSGKHAAM